MKRSIGVLFVAMLMLFAGCGESNDFGQPSGLQGQNNNTTVNPQPVAQATGTIQGQVLDATTGDPLEGVTVSAPATVQAQGNLTATTDSNGMYTIFNAPVGTYTITFQLSSFVEFNREVTVVEDETSAVATVVLTPGLTADERFRFVLTWGAEPPDYDSHLWLPETNPFHVFFSNRGDSENLPFATLDVDDITSFGPETMTLNQVLSGGTYEYAIHNYSQTGTVAGAVVEIYDQSGLIATVTPSNTNGEYWIVATIDGATRELTIVDQTLEDIRSPYTDSRGGTLELPSK